MGKWYTRKQTSIPSHEQITQEEEEDSGMWCFCKEGEMIGCDSKSCDIKWYHLKCVGMTVSTTPREKWLCPACHAKKYIHRRKLAK